MMTVLDINNDWLSYSVLIKAYDANTFIILMLWVRTADYNELKYLVSCFLNIHSSMQVNICNILASRMHAGSSSLNINQTLTFEFSEG